MATAAQAGIGGEVRTGMSRQQQEAQSKSVYMVNTGVERWQMDRDYGAYVIPERHAWTPVTRCAICGTEEANHADAMRRIAEAQEKYPPKPPNRPGIGPHEFQKAGEQCAVCVAPKSLHSPQGRYGVLVVTGALSGQDLGDNRKNRDVVYADEIAMDLMRENSLQRAGVFFSLTPKILEADLLRAEQARDARNLELVEAADNEWMRHHAIHLITDAAKRACRELGMDRDWLYTVRPKIDCPRCGTKLNQGVAICMACGAILDRAKYDAYEPPAAEPAAAAAETQEAPKGRQKQK